MDQQIAALLNNCKVFTTEGRGSSPEELADRALDKIIYVGGQSDPVVTAQANAFKERIRAVLIQYLREAQRSERDTICAKLTKKGQPEIAAAIRSL